MIREDIRNISSETDDLRKFGLTVGIVFAVFGAFFWWRGRDFFPIFLFLALGLILLGLVAPTLLRLLHKGWMTLAILMGWVMTRVILVLLFFLVILPIGLVMRLFGKAPLQLSTDSNLDSYWIYKDASKREHEDYERQF